MEANWEMKAWVGGTGLQNIMLPYKTAGTGADSERKAALFTMGILVADGLIIEGCELDKGSEPVPDNWKSWGVRSRGENEPAARVYTRRVTDLEGGHE